MSNIIKEKSLLEKIEERYKENIYKNPVINTSLHILYNQEVAGVEKYSENIKLKFIINNLIDVLEENENYMLGLNIK